MGQHVFISYKHEDETFAATLIRQVQLAGFTVWIDSEQLRAGENWREAINYAIRDAFALVVIMTPEAKASEYVTYEWAYALGAGVRIIPIMLRPAVMHPQLEMLQFLDFTDPARPSWDRLIRRLWEVQGEHHPYSIPLARDAPAPVRSAVAALDNHNADERRSALRALAQTNHASAYAALVAAVQHPLRDVRVDAAFLLAKQSNYKEAAAVPGLLDALTDEDSRIRMAAAKALGEIGDPMAVAPLLHILTDSSDSDLRWAATGALGRMGMAALPGLLEALQDDNWKVRRSAAEALWGMGEPKAVPGLAEALVDRNDVVRQAAAGALEAMGVAAVSGLIDVLRIADRQHALAVVDMLYRIGTPEARTAAAAWQASHNKT